MTSYVYYSKPKLVASLTPMLVIAAALFWVGLKSGFVMILACFWVLIVSALILKLSPFGRAKLELSESTISFGPGLASKIPLSQVKYASSGGNNPHGWPGSVSILLEMESRVSEGQRYFDRKVIELFCIDTPPQVIAERINSRIKERAL